MYRQILALEGGRATAEQYESLFGEDVKEKLLSQAFESPIHAFIFLPNSITTKLAQIAEEHTKRADEEKKEQTKQNRADNMSLLRCITLGNEHFDLRFVRSDSSHTKSRHIDAKATERAFTVSPVVEDLQTMAEINAKTGANPFKKQLGETPGGCLARTDPRSMTLGVASEGDIQAAVYNILQDAVCICNILLMKDRKCSTLNIRKEASLLTNRLDHLVVYASGQAILSVLSRCTFAKSTTAGNRSRTSRK
jgi:hypothetical protein